jgi:hypothetical protein
MTEPSLASVEILRPSPVSTTGVPTPDLVGWSQDDNVGERPKSTAKNGCATRDFYQGTRWIRPTRIRTAAASAIRTAQASRERRGVDFVCVCELVLLILILLRNQFCLGAWPVKERPASEGGPYEGRKTQERAGRARPLQKQEQPEITG